MHTETNSTVRITLTRDEFDLLLLSLGIAAGMASEDNPKLFRSIFRLVNAINDGNPNFTPYQIDPEPEKT